MDPVVPQRKILVLLRANEEMDVRQGPSVLEHSSSPAGNGDVVRGARPQQHEQRTGTPQRLPVPNPEGTQAVDEGQGSTLRTSPYL